MDRDQVPVDRSRFVRQNPGGRIFEVKGQSLERPRQLSRRVFLISYLGRAGDQVAHSGPPQVAGEDFIWIEEITDDLLKAGEIYNQLGREIAVAGEEAGQRPILN